MNNTVLDKVVASRRLPILFIGSGISKRYLYHYPNWEELLELSFKNIILICSNYKNTKIQWNARD